MALVPCQEKTVSTVGDNVFRTPLMPKKRKKVLEEEPYTKELEQIIQRDFFPDVPKLKAQNEYLEAEARNDVAKIRELQMQYRPTPKRRPDSSVSQTSIAASPLTFQSPATFETPASPVTRSRRKFDADEIPHTAKPTESVLDEAEQAPSSSVAKPALGLDDFLARVTSEDNASFEDIMEDSDKKHRRRYPWLYENDPNKKLLYPRSEAALAIQAGESTKPLAVEFKIPNFVETWGYRARNSVMQVPVGVEFTIEELAEREKQKIVVEHKNTRFQYDPWRDVSIAGGNVDANGNVLPGKVGADGNEINANATPKVNGYAFMASPSPIPGIGESPMMTWGEIEGTPFALDASDTPVLSQSTGPQFKIPDVPDRDKLHLELVDNVTKRHRVKREEALKQVRSLASSSPKFGSAVSAERLATMSPAAQKLATKSLGIRLGTDKALAASYSPSPRRGGSQTPGSTPGKGPQTPVTPSITDNLLDIRKKAFLDK